MPNIILGSSSPWRRKIMDRLGLAYTVMSPDIDEKAIRDPDPRALVLKIGRAKAAALVPRVKAPGLIITSDQVTAWGGEIREKPVDAAEARRWLVDYGTAPLQTATSVVITETATGRQLADVDVVTVQFRPIPPEVQDRAIAGGDIMRCCGAFATDDQDLIPYLESITGEGTDEETAASVIGLPSRLVKKLLAEFGVTSKGDGPVS